MTSDNLCSQEILDKAIKEHDLDAVKSLVDTGVCTDKLIERGLISAIRHECRYIVQFLINLKPIDEPQLVKLLGIAYSTKNIGIIADIREELKRSMVKYDWFYKAMRTCRQYEMKPDLADLADYINKYIND